MNKESNPITILLVDDDEDDRMLARDALAESRLANDLYMVEDGEELMDYLHRRGRYGDPASSPRPGLILLDLNMPVMTGEELLDRVRQNPETADLVVVVVSTESSSTRIAALRAKGAGFVHKPFNPVTLRDEVLRITGATIG